MASKRYAKVEEGVCVACGTCELVCPKGAILVVDGCCAKVNTDTCIGCGKCAKACPANCIDTVERAVAK